MAGCSVTYGEIRDAQIADYAPGCAGILAA
jgi:hypothetical protein